MDALDREYDAICAEADAGIWTPDSWVEEAWSDAARAAAVAARRARAKKQNWKKAAAAEFSKREKTVGYHGGKYPWQAHPVADTPGERYAAGARRLRRPGALVKDVRRRQLRFAA